MITFTVSSESRRKISRGEAKRRTPRAIGATVQQLGLSPRLPAFGMPPAAALRPAAAPLAAPFRAGPQSNDAPQYTNFLFLFVDLSIVPLSFHLGFLRLLLFCLEKEKNGDH